MGQVRHDVVSSFGPEVGYRRDRSLTNRQDIGTGDDWLATFRDSREESHVIRPKLGEEIQHPKSRVFVGSRWQH
jgi:hypothetical protein